MNLKMILSAASAAALLTAGAAQAQTMDGSTQASGGMQTQAAPADHKDSRTGLPSVDSTRATGAGAGATMSGDMSAGPEMNADTSGAVNAPGAMAGGDAAAATDAGSMASTTAAGANTEMVTNGPIPDTEENRARYGEPDSRAGKASTPSGN
ncbi:MAG: hypothetical protein Q7S93_07230 [Phenylobacterium sp.]|uniref:hypothetical protein n=1 Tax=Phenylobacterium sp. TaxID=1871053 RepID=UPI00271C2896|nr:hypothetical protein [Phenylobacterium sp.]MDO8409837.1 hypothetical protein [Phenylobacterium sp.]